MLYFPANLGREKFSEKMFPGLRLDVEAPLKDDMEKVLAVLQQGLASSEHKDFVERLSERNLFRADRRRFSAEFISHQTCSSEKAL